jgi:hypothetical protein
MPTARRQKDPHARHAVDDPMDRLRSFLQMHAHCPGDPLDIASESDEEGLHVALCCPGCGERLTVMLDSHTCGTQVLHHARAAGFVGSAEELWALGHAGIARLLESPTARAEWMREAPQSPKRRH